MKKIIFLLLLIIPGIAFAQEYVITGKVTDAKDGSPLLGVVIQTQAKTGTTTDFDGSYKIKANKGDRLTFSYVGMLKKTVTVESNHVINVEMEETDIDLEGIVVVGYGTMKKSDLTGSVSQIGKNRLSESVVTNIDQILQGRAAGVQVQANSGAPGAANSIRIRGITSLTQDNEPLYIIDGVRISGSGVDIVGFDWAGGTSGQTKVNPLSSIAPSDIVSIDILKDASACAIYGAAGANGVVLVTTKRGSKGHSNISYDGSVSYQVSPGSYDMLDLHQYAQLQQQLYAENFLTSINPAYMDISLLGKGTDWQDAVTKNAWMQNHNVSFNGGTDKTQYFMSVGHTNQDGILLSSDFKRYTGRINLDSEFNKYVKVGASLSFSRTDESVVHNDGIDGLIMQAALILPSVPIYGFDGNYAGPETTEGSTMYNPVALTKEQDNKLRRDRIMGNAYAQITFTKDLNLRSEYSFNTGNGISKNFKPSYKYGILENTNTMMMQREEHDTYWDWKNYANYSHSFNKHNISLMAGTEASKSMWESMSLSKEQLTNNTIHVITEAGVNKNSYGWKGVTTNVSFFGRVNYNFDQRYLLTATLRSDGSSKFGSNNRWGYFPSFAGAWRINSEKFMESTKDWLSNLKLRLGYGVVGNSNISNYLYGSVMKDKLAWSGTSYRMANNANPDLKWEKSVQYNSGLDIGLFNGRIDIAVDAYYKTTKDLLLRPSTSPILGGSADKDIQTAMMNIGKVENKGFDITINTHNITGQDFNWKSNLVFSMNRNKVKAMDEYNTPIYNNLYWYGGFATATMITVGRPVGVFYGYMTDGLYKDADDVKNSPRPKGNSIHQVSGTWVGDVKFKDISAPNGTPDGVIDEYDQMVIGNPNPDFTFGFTNTFNYKNWELGIGLTGSIGADILNFARVKTEAMQTPWDNQNVSVLERAQLGYHDGVYDPTNVDNCYIVNSGATLPRWSGNDNNGNARMSDRWIEDGSYLRIQNISLGYVLPKHLLKKIGVENMKVYLNAQNVHTFTNYSGLDPEIGSFNQQAGVSNVDMGRYPTPRVFTLGTNITF